MLSFRIAVAAALVPLTGACTFLFPTDELVGHSASDGGGTDGEVAKDGGGEDALATGSFCASRSPAPLLCADFDEPTQVDKGFDGTTQNGGTVTTDALAFVSSPSSMVAFLAATSGSGNNAAHLYKTFAFSPKTSVALSLDVRVDELDASLTAGLFRIDYGADAYVVLLHRRAGWALIEKLKSGEKLTQGLPGTTPAKTWAHIDIALAIGGTAPVLTFTLDGASTPVTLGEAFDAASLVLKVGLTYADAPGAAWRVRYDNVVFDAK